MISEERLKQAVHEAAEALDRSLPDPEACTYEPSPEFEARMQTLIREMGEKRERKERRRRLAHRAACLAIAVVACGGCFLGSNAQAREGLWGWIRDSFEGSQNYSFQSTPIPSGDLPAYTMDVPEEYHYVADQSIQSAEYAALTYENDAGNILALDYQYETENSSGSLSVFADEEDVQKVTVNGVSADLYVGENEDSTSIIVWMDPEDPHAARPAADPGRLRRGAPHAGGRDRGIGHAGGGGSVRYTGPAHRLSTDRGCRPGQGGHRAGLRHHPGHGPEQRGLRRGGLFRHPGQPDRALDLSDHERPCTGRAPGGSHF